MSNAATKWFEWKKLRKKLRAEHQAWRAAWKKKGEVRRYGSICNPRWVEFMRRDKP
jgi:hypothetical protein